VIVCPSVQAEELKADTTRVQLALPNVYEAEAPRAITEEEKNFDAFLTLRRVRADKRNAGQRKKRADAVSTCLVFLPRFAYANPLRRSCVPFENLQKAAEEAASKK
jgi:hypothetical protein